MHVPKCAGSSVNYYICSRWNSALFGRGVRINDVQSQGAERELLIQKARHSCYVYGHMSWATMDALARNRSAYVFTFFREPSARLYSLYRYATGLPLESRIAAVGNKDLAKRLGDMTRLEFLQSHERRVRYDLDNFTVRQFSGSLDVFPENDREWMGLVERAKENLLRLNYVGFHDRFSEGFEHVMRAIGLPNSGGLIPPHKNASSDVDGNLSLSKGAGWDGETRSVMEPLIRYDRELYAWARNRFL